jgi:pimeloyl-ACP methyl ester carboxylesterase
MKEAQLNSVQCVSPGGLHRMVYKELGERDNPNVVLCIHGITRVSDDFDSLAQELARDFRVICPDVVGRGRSGRLTLPLYYAPPQYLADMVTLIARLDVQRLQLVGTSMGGLIGMLLASLPDSPISRMVVNDVGPTVEAAALQRIAAYLGQAVSFESEDEGIAYVRQLSATFGPHSDTQWRKLGRDALRQNEAGKWERNYDLRIAEAVKAMTPESAAHAEARMWAAWQAIRCPVLLLRGQESDLLSPDTARRMVESKPATRLVEFAGVGHAPTLLQADQIDVVAAFLRAGR